MKSTILTTEEIERLGDEGLSLFLITVKEEDKTKQYFTSMNVELFLFRYLKENETIPTVINMIECTNLLACRKLSEGGIVYVTF